MYSRVSFSDTFALHQLHWKMIKEKGLHHESIKPLGFFNVYCNPSWKLWLLIVFPLSMLITLFRVIYMYTLSWLCCCRLILILMVLLPCFWTLLFNLLLMEACWCVQQQTWLCFVGVMGRFAIPSKIICSLPLLKMYFWICWLMF